MAEYGLGEVEMRFASLIWDKEPISSGELAKLSEKELGWKKSTTYTILKRLCAKEIFQNEKGNFRRSRVKSLWKKNSKVLCQALLLHFVLVKN